MPAKNISVNLLGDDDFSESPIGRVVTWAITYGRYIMITTEIIVLLAFISRFSLDRKLTDLNEAIMQKQSIIEANQPFEEEINTLSIQLSRAKTLMSTQSKPYESLQVIKSLLPADVILNLLTISTEKISARATVGSIDGLSQFMNNLQSTKEYIKVDIGDIKKMPSSGIQFQFSIQLTQPKPITPQKAAEPKS